MERESKILRFWIGNEQFLISELNNGKWVWSTDIDESKETYTSLLMAQQAAINHKAEEAAEKREERIAMLEAEVFGTYEEQVQMDYESKTK